MTNEAPSAALAELAHVYGVATEYWDWQGHHILVSATTIRAVLGALGVEAADDQAASQSLWAAHERPWRRRVPPMTLHRQGTWGTVRVHVPDGAQLEAWVQPESGGRLVLEQAMVWVDPRWIDGQLIGVATFNLPADLPLGWHTLHALIDGEQEAASGTFVVVPHSLTPPPGVDSDGAWGLMSQLYSVRSANSWGVGDFCDLADMAVWSARDLGADFTLINPVHAAEFSGPMEASPYLPTSRRFVNPLYIRVEDIPEVAYLDATVRAQIEAIAVPARARNTSERIDRDACWEAKKAALRLVYAHPRSSRRQRSFEAFMEAEGEALVDYATWCVLHELNDEPWPAELQDSRSAAVEQVRMEHLHEIGFVMWCQWIVDQQLAAVQREALDAGMTLGIMQDLAVGVHPDGSDAWGLRDALAGQVTVGAPPDPYNQRGQDWSQPPWRPDRLAELGYRPFRDMIRAALRHSGGLRVDHIIGLFRLWWIPEGQEPTEGTYVRYDHEALIGILTLEAHRAGAVIVGEDLGTVEPWVRDFLVERGVLGTSILWFERNDDGWPRSPEQYRRLCLASVTTHDLPPTAGYLTGEHIRVRDELGLFTRPMVEELAEDIAGREQMLVALRDRGLLEEQAELSTLAIDPSASQLEEIIEGLHKYLSFSPALLLGVSVPDLVGDRRTMNQPGTSTEYPNWLLPLAGPDRKPMLLEELMASRWARRLTRGVHRGRRP
ncbi:4-alpha-glucanotransferase [Kineosphaera limosa]|uniref:4-alpha-glucanotransferase n=1 Tax=Kineosphaera limosa NBRC 100340 TaxID=1184609 RepID=K6XDF2_9MICO|nr:4-alpha-glucanotransferase [Kineosphaera limosa]NYE02746.1 4-alpha-glucanotransferase [Kineosphaera limosa]GAB96824.1 4-alpha-glucanotransferase [Kineosphaera limosa NBRC 100340]